MKQHIKIFFLFLIVSLGPLPVPYTLLNIDAFNVISIIYIGVVLILFISVDKFLLKLLNAREVVETEKDEIYQMIKHESFKNSVKSPKLYSYRGQIPKILLLKGAKEYTLVFEEKIFDQLTSHEISSFVNFLLVNDRGNSSQLLSVCYLIGILLVKMVFGIRNLVFRVFKNDSFSKALFLTGIFFIKPFMYFLFWYAIETNLKLTNDQNQFYLKSAFLKLYSLKITESFADNFFVINKLIESTSKVVDVNILEVFPSSYIHLNKFYD